MTLRDFPRGGKKPTTAVQSDLLTKKKVRPKGNKSQNKSIDTEVFPAKDDNFISKTAECLTYSTLLEGMTVLGRIHSVTEYNIIVSLPGRISGEIPITNISESYHNLLQNLVESQDSSEFKSLSELYSRGDYLVCYIKTTSADGKYRVTLSVEPQLINQNLEPRQLHKGRRIVCSISSIEDHGYVVDTGIKTLRGFLSNNDVDNKAQYYPGQQIFCYIKSAKSTENITTMKLSTKAKLKSSILASDNQVLDSMAPGTRCTLKITKILSNGLQVTFNDSCIGYINQLYLKKPLSSYEKDLEISGSLLYVVPTIKFAYFSQQSLDKEQERMEIGGIVNARVLFRDSKGIMLILKKRMRGFLPFKRTEVNYDEINSKFTPDSVHKCRILTYDIFDRVYVCTMQRSMFKDDTLLPGAAKPGDTATVEIVKIKDSGFIFVKSGHTFGDVSPDQIADVDEDRKTLKAGHKVKARVLGQNKQGNGLMFTLKKSIVESKRAILADIKDAKFGAKYEAIIIDVKKSGLLARFFGNVKGWIPGSSLDRTIGGSYNYVSGQVVLVKIIDVDQERGKLTLNIFEKRKVKVEDIKIEDKFKIGDSVDGTVVESSLEGIHLKIIVDSGPQTITGFLPAGHMAPCKEMGMHLSSKYAPGDKLSALIFSITPEFLFTRTYAPQAEFTSFDNLKVHDCIPSSIKDINKNGLRLILPISGFDDYGVVPYHKLENINELSVHQILFSKITGINKKERKIFLNTCLSEIWADAVKNESDMITAVDLLTLHLSKLKELSNHDYYKSKKISAMHLGQRVSGIIDKVTDHGLVLKLENDVMATVRQSHFKTSYNIGDDVKGCVLWINYVYELVEVTLLPSLVNSISSKQNKLAEMSVDTQCRGQIVLVTNWFILVLLKGQAKGTLAALPARRHTNDLEPDLSPYHIGKKVRCYVILNHNQVELLPVCLVKSAFEGKKATELQNSILKRKSDHSDGRASKKRKVVDDTFIKEEPSDDGGNDDDKDDNKISKKRKGNKVEDVNQGIPECGFYWDTKPDLKIKEEVSSDSEDEEVAEPKQKKKKLDAAERREAERQKEREIREREEALASNQVPNSVDQFDRLVLASPDSSIIWLQYMAYHLQATEIDKARAVTKRALKTINFREENEKLNVWQAWLNLESRFGSAESLNDVLHQAINANDAMKIYLHMLTVHLEGGRQSDLEKTVKMVTGKFKEVSEVWVECGSALLKMGLKEKSRLVMQRALQSLPPQEHINLMVKFAQLENKFGDKERAETLFDNILTSYPKRVDVWCSYVDCLVKNGNFDAAGKVLEKAVNQSLPPKKMKTLFKKLVTFEEQHGSAGGVAHAKELALAYVESVTKKSNK